MVSVIAERVAGGDYEVDPQAVAAAILERRASRSGWERLCSEMLVAAQSGAADAPQPHSRAVDDAP